MDSEPLTVRLPRELLEQVDSYRREQDDPPTRPEAIRRLVAEALVNRLEKSGKE